MKPLQYSTPSRRALLGGIATVGVASAALHGTRAATTNVDVVIVGAGAAGIGAAIKLKQAGLSYVIVEAANRVGGRAFTDTTTFRGDDGKPVPFDIGCAWIHRNEPNNQMGQWARKLKFEIQRHDLDVNVLYYGRTPYSPAMVELEHKAEEDLEGKFKEAVAAGRDVAGSTFLEGTVPPTDAAATYMGPMDMAADFDEMSCADYDAMPDYNPNYLVRAGYGSVVKMIALESDLNITLGTPVTAIDTSGSGVRVTTARGTIDAKAAIVTVSTGVLGSGAIRFTQPLPAEVQGAIADVPMGCFLKIPLEIPGVNHWVRGIKPYDNVMMENPGLDDIYFLAWPWNLDLMVGFVGGKFGKQLAKNGQAAAIDFAKQKVGDIFGSDMRKRVRRGLLTPWATNPLTHGSYSAAKPGKFASRAVLRKPVWDKLYFAGEAVAPNGMFATCEGAYNAGQAAVAGITAKVRPG